MWRRRESWEGVNGGTNLSNKEGRWMWKRRESWEGGDGGKICPIKKVGGCGEEERVGRV